MNKLRLWLSWYHKNCFFLWWNDECVNPRRSFFLASTTFSSLDKTFTHTPIKEVRHIDMTKIKREQGRILYIQVSISVNVKCTLQSSIRIELWWAYTFWLVLFSKKDLVLVISKSSIRDCWASKESSSSLERWYTIPAPYESPTTLTEVRKRSLHVKRREDNPVRERNRKEKEKTNDTGNTC